ncbi:MAG: Inosose isomerase [Pseudomonadota bacterium]|jgi:sugar phosphate isomerase/epimerase
MNTISGFGMDTITLGGTLPSKLRAMRDAGFEQVMLMARDLVGHADGMDAAVRTVRDSGLRPTGFQVLRDFEGLSGHLHDYKVDVAKSILKMCTATGAKTLLACSSSLKHASLDPEHIVADLRKLAMLALPLGIRVAYEALSWGRQVNETEVAYDLICRADCHNLGLGLDSFHLLAAGTPIDIIDDLDPERIFLVQLSDFMWQETPTFEDRMATARTYRVFPGEGVHTEQVADMVVRLDRLGYAGDYSFEVFNDDYQQLPLDVVARRARRSALWLGQEVLQRPVPLPDWTRL